MINSHSPMRRVAFFAAILLLASVAGRSAHALSMGWFCPPTPTLPCSSGSTCWDGPFWTCTTTASPASLYAVCALIWYPWSCSNTNTCPGLSTFGGQTCSCNQGGNGC